MDYKNMEEKKPPGKITGKRLFVVSTILLTELCERLTYYSVVANMVLFCTSVLKYTSDEAALVTLIFAGIVLCCCLETKFKLWNAFTSQRIIFPRFNVLVLATMRLSRACPALSYLRIDTFVLH